MYIQIEGMGTSNNISTHFCLHRDITCAGNDDLIGGSYFIALVVKWCGHSTHSTHKSTPRAVAQGARCGWCAVCIVVDSYRPSTLQADACSGGGHDCRHHHHPAICCLSAPCLSCRPSLIATAHPPCKQQWWSCLLLSPLSCYPLSISMSSVMLSVVNSYCLSTLQADACSSGHAHSCHRLSSVKSSIVDSCCPSTPQVYACSGGGRASSGKR